MVAHTAITLPAGVALQSDNPSLSCPSVPEHLYPSLLNDLTSPHHSLASIAQKHNLALDALLIWLAQPETLEAISLREHAAYTHVRLVAAVNLSHAVHATVRTLEHFVATPRPADPLEPTYLRAAIHARKAAWLLSRFSRIVPINDARGTAPSSAAVGGKRGGLLGGSALRADSSDTHGVTGETPRPEGGSRQQRSPLQHASATESEPVLHAADPLQVNAISPSAPMPLPSPPCPSASTGSIFSPFDNVAANKTPHIKNLRTNKLRAPLQAATLVAAAGSIDST
ncbi:MAG: hypothetical protein KF902_06760 [Phycisphaeraceae bacterium]|nr:hypothetical protein [Phycisphaeraceae bacterium]